MTVLGEVVLGVALGLSLAVPPGPMNAWIAVGSARNYRAGVATGLGAMSADAVLGVLVYLLERSVDLSAVVRLVYGLGAAVMAFLAYRLLRPRRRPTEAAGKLRSYGQAFALGLTNPFQILWWLTAGIGFAYVGGAPLLLALFGAIAAWVVGFPALVRAGVRRSPRVEQAVRFGSGIALAGFAAYFLLLALLVR